MKRTRRALIEFLHREVTITVEGSTLPVQDTGPYQDGQPDTASAPAICPECGSPWLTLVESTSGDASGGVDSFRSVLQQSGLHLQVSPAGQFQICQRSFEERKEKL